MRKIIAPLMVLFVISGYANNPKIDHLIQELEQSSSSETTIKIYRDLSKVYYKTQVKFDSAFYYTKLAYEIAQDEGLKLQQGQTLFDQASIFRAVGDVERAIELYGQSIKISRVEAKVNSKAIRLLVATINNMGDIYLANRDFQNAKDSFNEVVSLTIEHDMRDIEAVAYLNLAEITYYEGKYEDSERYIHRSGIAYPSFKETLPTYYLIAAKTNMALDKNEDAEKSALKGLAIAQKTSDLQNSRDLASFLYNYYGSINEYKSAHVYGNMVLSYKDSLDAGANRKELDKLLLGFRLKEQESELEQLAQKNKYLTTIYVLGGLGTVLLLVLVSRQVKIVRMTRNIRDVQNNLIQNELDKLKSKESGFQATLEQDKEYANPDFI